jgi:hypothetical protein
LPKNSYANCRPPKFTYAISPSTAEFEKPSFSARLLRIGAPAPVFAFLRFRAGV